MTKPWNYYTTNIPCLVTGYGILVIYIMFWSWVGPKVEVVYYIYIYILSHYIDKISTGTEEENKKPSINKNREGVKGEPIEKESSGKLLLLLLSTLIFLLSL